MVVVNHSADETPSAGLESQPSTNTTTNKQMGARRRSFIREKFVDGLSQKWNQKGGVTAAFWFEELGDTMSK